MAVGQLALDGTFLSVNDRLCEILRRPRTELLEKNFREFFQAAETQSDIDTALGRLAAAEIPRYSTQMSAMNPGGGLLWFDITFSSIPDGNAAFPQGLTLVASDITSLVLAKKELHDSEQARDELSRRLLNAQEAERTRIARELHDDIGQSLAVLKIQMLRAGQPVSGHPGQRHAEPGRPRH